MSRNAAFPLHALEFVESRIKNGSLPVSVRDNVQRHQRNLTRLADNLGILGMDRNEIDDHVAAIFEEYKRCLLYTSPSPRDQRGTRMPSSA